MSEADLQRPQYLVGNALALDTYGLGHLWPWPLMAVCVCVCVCVVHKDVRA